MNATRQPADLQPSEEKRASRGIVFRILVDIGLTAGTLALLSLSLTGLTIHEWLGIAIGVAFAAHLVVSWRWLAATTKRFFGPITWGARVKYILNAALFIVMVVEFLSGLMISQVVFPQSGANGGGQFWKVIHVQSGEAILWLMALHVAIFWQSLVGVLRRLVSGVTSRRDELPSGEIRKPAEKAA